MPRPSKGKKTPGSGRTKGTLNKDTQDLFEICERHKCSVFESMVIIAVNDPDPDRKFEKLEKIAQYLYPKRKAVEMDLRSDEGIRIIIEDYKGKDK